MAPKGPVFYLRICKLYLDILKKCNSMSNIFLFIAEKERGGKPTLPKIRDSLINLTTNRNAIK